MDPDPTNSDDIANKDGQSGEPNPESRESSDLDTQLHIDEQAAASKSKSDQAVTDLNLKESDPTVDWQLSEPPDEQPPLQGKIDRYQIVSELGKGGFGTVVRARDEVLDRDVAIKLPTAIRISPRQLKAWISEAQVVASLDHPHIVPVFDVGQQWEIDEGWNYCVHDRRPGEVRVSAEGRIISDAGTSIFVAHGNARSLKQFALVRH